MRHAADANEFLEVPRDERRPVVGDDPGTGWRIFFLGSFQDGFLFLPLCSTWRVAQAQAASRFFGSPAIRALICSGNGLSRETLR
jgi:hypothetical protein